MMSTTVSRRSRWDAAAGIDAASAVGEPPDQSPLELAAPPRQGESTPLVGSMGMILVPAASGVGAVLLAVTQQDRPLLAAAGLLVLAASVAVGLIMVIGSRSGDRRRTRDQRARYLDHLELVAQQARLGAAGQHHDGLRDHPDPAAAHATVLRAGRRPERRAGDPNFLLLRTGLGEVRLRRPVLLSDRDADPLLTYDPICVAAARELSARYATMAGQPIILRLSEPCVISVRGAPERVHAVARALLGQVVASHRPDDVGVLVCSADIGIRWDWLKWLPHSHSAQVRDGPLAARMMTADGDDIVDMLAAEIDAGGMSTWPARRMLVVIDDVGATDRVGSTDSAGGPTTKRRGLTGPAASALAGSARAMGAGVLTLLDGHDGEPDRVDARVTVGGGIGRPAAGSGAFGDGPDLVERFGPGPKVRAIRCRLDGLAPEDASLLARSFAPLWPSPDEAGSRAVPIPARWPVSATATTIDPTISWQQRPGPDVLRVPIGTADDGTLVVLDLKEAARGGVGPHGLVVGATGSGKSELLRTLVTGLVIGHPPDDVAVLFADFKGGATFAGFARLPHVAGMITNLEADSALIDRFAQALGGELQRRQEMLAAAGTVSSLDAYRELRRRRPDLESLPRLLVIVDEFSELLGTRPELADLFVTVGRIGRSIGVHLLLATQRLDTGRIRGLDSHLSYRICLRTFSESESREAIGSAQAHHLPSEPGWALLRAGGAELRRFRAATVSRPHRPLLPSPPPDSDMIVPFEAINGVAHRVGELRRQRAGGRPAAGDPVSGAAPPVDRPDTTLPGAGEPLAGDSVLDVAVDRLCAGASAHPHGRPVRRVWIDPLPTSWALGDLPDPVPGRQATANGAARTGLLAVLGMVDRPERQRQDPLTWSFTEGNFTEGNFTEGNGNLLIVGAGRSGKSTAAATMALSLALRHPPEVVQLVCIDFGGGAMVPFAELPHVAAVATRSDPDLTRRVFTRLTAVLAQREDRRIGGTGAHHQAGAAETGDGDIVLIVDGWSAVHDLDDGFDEQLDEILTRGPGLGVHTVLTVAAPGQLRPRLATGFGGRIELRLADPFDSVIDRQLAKDLPPGVPGRALVAGRHYAQIALPLLGHTGEPGREAEEPVGDQPVDEWDRRGAERPGAELQGAELRGDEPLAEAPAAPTVTAAVQHAGRRWPGRSVPRIRTLPRSIGLDDLRRLPRPTPPTTGVLLGVTEDDLPLCHDLHGADPHLVIYGDPGSGKTTLLRSLLAQLVGPGPEVLVVDHRRGPLSEAAQQLARNRLLATGPAESAALCAALARELGQRLIPDARGGTATGSTAGIPGGIAGGNPGAEPGVMHRPIYLLIDDYELVSATTGHASGAIVPFLSSARDIGFHLVISRRTGGAARAQYEPLLQTLGDLGTPVVLLSGSPAEGRIAHGLAPRVLPPGRGLLATRTGAPTMIQTPCW